MASPVPSIPDAPSTRSAADQQPRRRRRWPWVLAAAIVLAVAALYWAPVGIARHLEEEGIAFHSETAGEEIEGGFVLRAEKLSLGWLSPARLSDVSIVDSKGRPLMTAESIMSIRPLSRLLMNRSRPGRFVIRRPHLDVKVRPVGSNLEDFLNLLSARRRGRFKMSEMAVSVTDGRIDFHDPHGALLASIEDIDIEGSHQRGTDRTFDLELTAAAVRDGERGPMEAAISWRAPLKGLPLMSGTGTAALKFDALPLDLIKPHLSRVMPDTTVHGGTLAGQLLVECDLEDAHTVRTTGQLIARDFHATSTDKHGRTKEYRWAKEELAFHLDGGFDPDTDAITLSEVTLQSTPVSFSATGTISDVHGESLVDVNGNLQYDVSPLVQSLEANYKESVRIEGLQTRAFAVYGPLARLVDGRPRWDASRLSVEADLGWEAADVFGVRSEQATILARLEEGVLSLDPRHVPLSGGRLTAAPRVTFADGRRIMQIGSGPALEQVELSPQMCRTWLKYLSPPMADATQINGRFSINFEHGQIPLKNMADGQLNGVFHVHAAQVRPGPFAERVIGVVGMLRRLVAGKPGWSLPANNQMIAMDDQQVPFVMQEGRVHHEHLEFTVAGAVVETSGSVGLDDSLDLLIAIPLPESWLNKADIRSTLGGEVIRIPVRGTLDQPQFDLLPLRELAQRLALKATGGLLQKLFE